MIVYFLPLLTQRRYNVPTRNEAHNTQKRREFIFPKYPRKAEKKTNFSMLLKWSLHYLFQDFPSPTLFFVLAPALITQLADSVAGLSYFHMQIAGT